MGSTSRILLALLGTSLAAGACVINVTPPTKKTADGGSTGDGSAAADPILYCRTFPEAGPEICIDEYQSTNTITVSGNDCTVSATVNGQAYNYSGYLVSTCP